MEIAAVLSRFSSKLQHSTHAQVQHTVEYAARHKMYVPPEYICVDEAEKGRRVRRDGLERAKVDLGKPSGPDPSWSLRSRVCCGRGTKASSSSTRRWSRKVCEPSARARESTPAMKKPGRHSCILHGMMDEMLLDTIADHCRAGLKTLFQQGFTTGAIPVGYRRAEVPDAPRTNRGLPRTMPQVDPGGR